jgi:hypothetical protein
MSAGLQHTSSEISVGEALERLSLADGFLNPAGQNRKWRYFEVLGFRIYCYNFAWRKKVLAFHDLHHVVTGYPCTMRGEMQVATWEFAARRCPSLASNLFCLPLAAAGVVLMPRRMVRAYRLGRRSRSLFG